MRRPIILDTQLMVLLVVGMTSIHIIPKHKNLTAFTIDDFELLSLLIGAEAELILLPNTVSEAANLLRQHKNPERTRIMQVFAELINQHEERYFESALVVKMKNYLRLGITDAAILKCCDGQCEILTADVELYVAAANEGMRVVNFNHKREDFGLI
ncbi:PIN domain-containing protein [Methylobacterium oryzisoli]|uniref:PIN domain-containing protein n=1 Tax=Methylobacterium oryzisoli TaxID=3385502 RepID=UPI003891428A